MNLLVPFLRNGTNSILDLLRVKLLLNLDLPLDRHALRRADEHRSVQRRARPPHGRGRNMRNCGQRKWEHGRGLDFVKDDEVLVLFDDARRVALHEHNLLRLARKRGAQRRLQYAQVLLRVMARARGKDMCARDHGEAERTPCGCSGGAGADTGGGARGGVEQRGAEVLGRVGEAEAFLVDLDHRVVLQRHGGWSWRGGGGGEERLVVEEDAIGAEHDEECLSVNEGDLGVQRGNSRIVQAERAGLVTSDGHLLVVNGV